MTRDDLLDRVHRDLVGPQDGEREVIKAYPGDQYLTGILYPRQIEQNEEDAEKLEIADDSEGSPGEAVPTSSMRRPSTMGISLSISGKKPGITVNGSAGRYERVWEEEGGELVTVEGSSAQARWRRIPIQLDATFEIVEGIRRHPSSERGLVWFVRGYRTAQAEGSWQVTVVLANELAPGPRRLEAELATFYQVGFSVRADKASRLAPRPAVMGVALDEDERTNALIYRGAVEWAVGHTCSASWSSSVKEVDVVETAWVPRHVVSSMDASGHPLFREESVSRSGSPTGCFQAAALADATDGASLVRLLEAVPGAYRRWLEGQRARVQKGDAGQHAATANEHLTFADDTEKRIRRGIALLESNEKVRFAFQLAQGAMQMQQSWKKPGGQLVWRPFQLGFQLLTIPGLAAPVGGDGSISADRVAMDLLWFPTGGGKTEAYLALTAFSVFLRRLRQEDDPDAGAGVGVLMRYTLRLLTIQQFERASRLILACERTRQERTGLLGTTPFSIGLWVGSDATPNKIADARKEPGIKLAKQLKRCPACGKDSLIWDAERTSDEYIIRCPAKNCFFQGQDLPIWTIDEEVYRRRPSLVIGTIDKFAQIVRKKDTTRLFGGLPSDADRMPPPELIIQDELHLISGPLGTLAGLYECAIDQLCTVDGVPPKIIGSTATIRRARQQVSQLFGRNQVHQFPPPVIDATDSCFAVLDEKAPGRLYVGVTTAGRSPKFVLQAVYASLMQNVSELQVPPAERDPYWTLVGYFNSLRELGGALVMMRDDVHDSVENYARLHGTTKRKLEEEPHELTSRVSSDLIPTYLADLEESHPAPEAIDAVLATNMISVGMDVPRLGLMVMNGQPKGMAEYIQATSRVGRGNVPGVIVTVYSAGRPRDRSHFEGFKTWHQTLYREVEATSVTPFAARARDRVLHAAIVALARHRVPGMLTDPVLDDERLEQLQVLVDEIIARARSADSPEADGVQADAEDFLEEWKNRGKLEKYWADKGKSTLLISAETAATQKAVHGAQLVPARPTPNSMREVEPSVEFRMTQTLARREAK